MQFTRLRLNGFKSFVDPTELVIGDGLTGVVGPNGCGKSNLLEALRWVMGETRPSAMRGDGMEDVIFAGTARRPPRHFAEVALTIDNGERLAPAGFNDADLLDIVRRITRDAGSAYKVNGRDARARDVQMLFADASTGAHSPALVRQGQIAELIAARPQARRRILEEAAGISGLYQRRHEAELKLKGADANLLRVDDVIEGLAQQMAQLARQARQAARYRALSGEMRAAEERLLVRVWSEAEAARAAAAGELRARLVAAGEAERAARAAAAAREAAEARLPALREEAAIAAAVGQRLTLALEALADEEARAADRIRGLDARIAQLLRDRDREEALTADAAETIGRLEAEAAALAGAEEGHPARLAAAGAAAEAAADLLRAREGAFAERTEDVARLAAAHQSAQRRLDDARLTVRRAGEAAARAEAGAAEARRTLAAAEAGRQAAAAVFAAAGREAAAADAALTSAEAERSAAQAGESGARAARSAAEGEVAGLGAERAALARLVAHETGAGGQVLDRLRVRAGLEKALGAALADDLRAPVVDAAGATGWTQLAPYAAPQPLPDGIAPLADAVSGPGELARRLSQIGLVAAAEGARLQAALLPGQRLVSAEGDLWRWDGYRAGAADAPSAAALRLQQRNRLDELTAAVAAAGARAAEAAARHEGARAALARATAGDAAAREARRAADRRLAEASRAQAAAQSEGELAAGRLESSLLAVNRHRDEAGDAARHAGEAEAALAGLGDLGAARDGVEALRLAAEAARLAMLTRRSEAEELRRSGEDRRKRASAIARDLDGWRSRAASAGSRVADLEARRAAAEAERGEAGAVPAAIADRRRGLAGQQRDAGARCAEAGDALAAGEAMARAAAATERDAGRAAADTREARAAAEARSEAAGGAVALAAHRIETELGVAAAQLADRLGPTPLPPAADLEAEVSRLRRLRDALGAVNLRAEEDARSVEVEHDALTREKADLEAAIRSLRSGIASLNREGRERLLTAFEQVNANFGMLFRHLFGGGEARLEMVESDDPLDAGLEILCQPPGKRLAALSLLSGGEQTLTALALIFAVFLANPAPICVLDEVDAPLDDANVGRFCDLLDEMTRRAPTRFLIITHHSVTMARMDRLFGVTMGEQGVSQLVSVDLHRAAAMSA